MDRRQFVKALGVGAIGFGVGGTVLPFAGGAPKIAVTIDDFNFFGATPAVAEKRNRALLGALSEHSGLKAAAFIAGRNVDNEVGKRLVGDWGRAGHLVANHTYSHQNYNGSGFEEYAKDILRVETLIKDLPRFTKRFRFPMLKEGDTAARRDNMRAFLKRQGYAMGYVTIDASDWYIDQRLRARLAKDPSADPTPYKEYYLNHLWDRAGFYDSLSRKVLGRSVMHTLLIHHNVLNELFLGDVLKMFVSKGWKLIGADEAFKDSVFNAAPNILPAGESIIWALAKESGKFDDILRYPAESDAYEKPKMDKLGL